MVNERIHNDFWVIVGLDMSLKCCSHLGTLLRLLYHLAYGISKSNNILSRHNKAMVLDYLAASPTSVTTTGRPAWAYSNRVNGKPSDLDDRTPKSACAIKRCGCGSAP